MADAHERLVLHVDGGARGNPGPAAIGIVVDTPDGVSVARVGETIGETTNNVAEYRALIRGLELATERGAREIHVINDSELVARQINGIYRVKHPGMQALHREALAALARFDSWEIESVPRARNAQADALVNRALDGEPLD